jgi:hypothetical protein
MAIKTPMLKKPFEGLMSSQGFAEKKTFPSGATYSRPSAGGSPSPISSSFEKMLGRTPSLGELESSSMRLADAAAKREMKALEFESGLKEKMLAKDYKVSQKESEIAKLEEAIKNVGPGVDQKAVQEDYRQKIQRLKNEIDSLLNV